ncbi:MAG TPA: PAS domain S-box protein [Anaerolineae bacterium]|nr:PAS domain S-box protein [Anaerolineae bacterium]HID84595.1 PAS domain S-box protein [Anaerolineales bacterium]HIQ08399.1 PAS domain S-box protein [Anaerolineaceae bacterium]
MPLLADHLPPTVRAFWEQRVRPLWEHLVAPHPDLKDFGDQLRARVLAVLSLTLLGLYFFPEALRLLTTPIAKLSQFYILLTSVSVLTAYALSRTRRPLLGAWVLLLALMAGPSVGLLATPEVTVSVLYHNISWGILALIISALLLPIGQFVLLTVLGMAGIMITAHLHGVPDDWLIHPLITFGIVALILLSLLGTRQRFVTRIAESEQRFRDLFNSTLEALVIHDGQRILAVNPAFEEMFHCQAEEAIGQAPLAFVAPEEREKANHAFQAPQDTPREPRTLIRATALRPDGSTFIAEAISARVTHKGRPVFALSIRDVTEQVRTAEALQRERNFLQHILESIHDPFYVIDVQTFQILVANSAAREKGNPSATTCYAFSHRRDTPCSGLEHPCPLQQVVQTGEPFTVEHIHYRDDGTPHFMEVHGYPIRDEQGRVVQMVEYAVDITARKQAEAEIHKLQQAIEQSANAILITDREGHIEYINPAFTRMTGYTPEEILGENPRILKSGYHSAEFYARMWDTLLRGETWRGEILNKRKDGSLYWERETITPVRDDQGRIIHFIAIKEDITAQKAAEEQIRKLQQAVEQSANAIMITNRQGIIEYVNPAFTRLTGYAPEEVIGHNPRLLKSGKQPPSFYEQLWHTILRGKTWRGEILNKRKDGSLYWEHMTITPVLDAKGEITHFVAIKEDITQRKEMEEALRQARDQALEANRLKTSLLANVSHDMRTPLGGILGFAEMLQSEALGPLNDDQRRALQHILSSTQTLMDFTNDLLDQAELESGRLRLNIQPFAPQDLLKVLPSYVGLAQAKGVSLHTEVDPAIPSPIYGDLYWIRRILANLLSNAVKFTKEGHIWIRLFAQEGDRWAIQVEDSGPGIPPEKQKLIFEPFRQGEEGPTRRHKGSGLGLSIVKQLVELMHGEIHLESTPGKGSTFTVILPCQAHAPQEERP